VGVKWECVIIAGQAVGKALKEFSTDGSPSDLEGVQRMAKPLEAGS
jgi:hypothetical protein